MGKVLTIGIDSLDSTLLSRFEKDLPNFRRLKEGGPTVKLRSVCPPDSVTAWASIYTGLNPARHGIVYFVDPIDKVSTVVVEDVDNSVLRGRTFWDFAGRLGKKVCIIFPHIGYPVWPVNGVILGRSNQRDTMRFPIQAYPPSISEKYDLSNLNTVKGYPPRKVFGRYIESCQRLVLDETKFGLKMLRDFEWDLFFIFSSAMDWIEHNLWMYHDESDPSYPGDNPYTDVIPSFYKLYDQMIGKLIAAADSDTMAIVLSDHGHGRRPTKIVNINEVLRRRGFLVPRIKKPSFTDPYYLLEVLKGRFADFVNKYGIGDPVLKLMHAFPNWRKMYTSPPSIDWGNTMAYVSDLSGIKAYTYGGIIIRRKNLKDIAYDELVDLLIQEISEIKEPSTGKNLVKWVCHRDALYSGEYLSKYPDIVFELKYDYGAGWAIHDSLISPCRTHSVQPGSHMIDGAVFLASNVDHKDVSKEEATLMDIAPTMLNLLGIEGDFGFEGKSVFC